jgi:hypothetical protein
MCVLTEDSNKTTERFELRNKEDFCEVKKETNYRQSLINIRNPYIVLSSKLEVN